MDKNKCILSVKSSILCLIDVLKVLMVLLIMKIPSANPHTKSAISKENYLFDVDEHEIKIIGRSTLNDDFKSKITTKEDFIKENLEATNDYRLIHGVEPLKLDYKLSLEAEEWANHLAEKSDSEGKPFLKPSWKYKTGENIFAVYGNTSDAISGSQVADNWYKGCNSHVWEPNFFSKQSSRFSQLVWKDSERMGIGKAIAKKLGIVIAVARYIPPGNWNYRSAFKANVFPAKDKPDKCEAKADTLSKSRGVKDHTKSDVDKVTKASDDAKTKEDNSKSETKTKEENSKDDTKTKDASKEDEKEEKNKPIKEKAEEHDKADSVTQTEKPAKKESNEVDETDKEDANKNVTATEGPQEGRSYSNGKKKTRKNTKNLLKKVH